MLILSRATKGSFSVSVASRKPSFQRLPSMDTQERKVGDRRKDKSASIRLAFRRDCRELVEMHTHFVKTAHTSRTNSGFSTEYSSIHLQAPARP